MTRDLMKPDHARNMRLVGHSDQGGRRDGIQVMVEDGFAYIGHLFSRGFSVIDVRDPANPKPAGYVQAPDNTWNVHLQAADGLLLVIHGKDVFADAAFADEASYYKAAAGTALGTAEPKKGRDWDAGLAVYDIATEPGRPRRIGFMPVSGGIHRIWWVGGRWAYVSALLDGYTDFIFMTVDMSDPANPREAGRYALPGMHQAAGETPSWSPNAKFGLHHAIVDGDIAWGAWRDAGLVVMDIADRTQPKLIRHTNWSPPFQGGTHNCLPISGRDLLVVVDEAVLDDFEDGLKNIWIFNVANPENPVPIATMPPPSDQDYTHKGAHYGPHNIHENRPGSFQSSSLIFSTWQNAGVRVYDISNAYQPKEVGALVPPAPEGLMDRRPGKKPIIQSCDIFVDKTGLAYVTDYNAGLYIMEYTG
ncbi:MULTISPECIES: hypothetical protein [unclassified Martelella]|uniref:LVIVD repeat-containing protein n=1 Tax=unclassified Martelella TaxID=2629616 RepID=UPI0025BE1019|nr:hypothetical protein [Martelella sp.]